jgi:hypothetical protein
MAWWNSISLKYSGFSKFLFRSEPTSTITILNLNVPAKANKKGTQTAPAGAVPDSLMLTDAHCKLLCWCKSRKYKKKGATQESAKSAHRPRRNKKRKVSSSSPPK